MKLALQWPGDLRDLVPGCVAIGSLPVPDSVSIEALPPGERQIVACAVSKRRREFAAGRRLARGLLHEQGIDVEAIGQHADRTPAWPEGVIGSISHCDDLCVAAVARTANGVHSLGIDVEPAEPLPRELPSLIARDVEWESAAAADQPGLFFRRLFSAKEAYFKCAYPILGRLIEFTDLQVDFGRQCSSFEARIVTDGTEGGRAIPPMAGRQMVWERWIVTAVTWTTALDTKSTQP